VVSTEALDFFALSALAHVSARARHSACSMEFGELGRVANLRDDPGVRPEIACGLLLDDPADRRRPKSDGVTRLCDGDVVLSPVLAEEQSLFTFEQICQIQAAYRHIDFEFHLFYYLSFFTLTFDSRASVGDRHVI